MPIIDYHNHLSPNIIANNEPFSGINEIWLRVHYYKWRAMRTLGIEEKFITGKNTRIKKNLINGPILFLLP